MIKILPTLAVGVFSSGLAVSAAVWVDRSYVRGNILTINRTVDRLENHRNNIYVNIQRDFGETKDWPIIEHALSMHLQEDREKDEAWRRQALATQEEWLKLPFYKQLGSIPFPNYVDMPSVKARP